MAKNLLLEYSEELATKCELLCKSVSGNSNTVFQLRKSSSSVFANITEAQYPQSLADMLYKPLTYVRSSSKDHGLGHQIEGLGKSGSYEGKNVLLIEDLISTGSSSLKAVEAVREADGVCNLCLAIFTYGLKKAEDAFAALDPECVFHTILSYDVMVATAAETGYISESDAEALHEWREDPFGWGEKRGWKREVRE